MESFGNLGYTLGGNIQPGSGTAKFGYTPNLVNPPSFPPPVNNRSPYGQTSGWNGWQYNPSTMNPNTNNNQGGGGSFNIPNNQNSNNNPNSNLNNNNANAGFSVGFSQQNQNSNQNNQHNIDWRNIQQSGTPSQYQPVTTTGPSSFQFRDPQQMAQSYPYPYNINGYSNTSNNPSNNRNIPNTGNNMMGHYGQGAASMVPTNPNSFAIPSIIEEKPLQCHVKIGDQGQEPIVYVNGINPNDKNAQNYANANGGNNNNNQVQYNHSAGEPQPQQPHQTQQQHQQMQINNNHSDTTQMMNQINTQIQNQHQHQQQPQQMGQMVQSLGQVQGQGQGQRNMTTPCGCCAACRAQMSNKMLGANQPQIVRGPKVQPRPNMMKTASAPQMTIPNGENQMMMMQQQQQNMNHMNGNQGDVNPIPVPIPISQMQTNPLVNMAPIPIPIQQHQNQHQQHRQPFLS